MIKYTPNFEKEEADNKVTYKTNLFGTKTHIEIIKSNRPCLHLNSKLETKKNNLKLSGTLINDAKIATPYLISINPKSKTCKLQKKLELGIFMISIEEALRDYKTEKIKITTHSSFYGVIKHLGYKLNDPLRQRCDIEKNITGYRYYSNFFKHYKVYNKNIEKLI